MKKGYKETMAKGSHDEEGKPIYGAPVNRQGTTRSDIQTVMGFVKVRVQVQQEIDGTWCARVPALTQDVAKASTKMGAIKAACDALSTRTESAWLSG